MTTPTSNLGLLKGVGSDNWRTYLKTSLAASLDVVDKAVGQVVNVKGYGAKGDGTTDDTAAIRSAIAAVGTNGMVFFPGGPGTVYVVGASGSTYSLTLASNLTIRGEGGTLKRKSGNTEKLLGAGSALSDVLIRDLVVDNQDQAIGGGGVLYVPTGSSRVALERVRVTRLAAATAVLVDTGTSQSTDVRLVDCAFERTLANGASENIGQVYVYDASRVWVERCRFDTVGALEIYANNATACPTTNPMSHVYVRGCVFERVKTTCLFVGPAVASTAMHHVMIEGNSFQNVGKEIEKGAIVFGGSGTMRSLVIRGNTIRDWGYTGSSTIGAPGNAGQAISGGPCDGVVIEGNTIDALSLAGSVPASSNYGMAIGGATRNLVIRGNTIQNCGSAGIRLEGSSGSEVRRFVVAENVVYACLQHNDSTLKEGAIHLADYVTDGTIAGNVCVDNGAGAGAGPQDAGIATGTGASATTIRDVKIVGNHCYDTRSAGSKTQLYGVRVGLTGSSDSAQPTRVTLQANDVGGANADGGNATAGLYYQRTVDLGYAVADNAGFDEATTSVAAANDLALPARQRGAPLVYRVTGATQINRIDSTGFKTGDVVTLCFASNPTVKSNQATSGAHKIILLAGQVDFTASQFDTLTLVYEGDTAVAWCEISRCVI